MMMMATPRTNKNHDCCSVFIPMCVVLYYAAGAGHTNNCNEY